MLLSRQDFDKKVKVKYTKVEIGIDVYITNSSTLLIPDWQPKTLPGWVWGFLTTLKRLSYHSDNKLKNEGKNCELEGHLVCLLVLQDSVL